MNPIVQMGIDLYHNRVANYSATEAQEMLRKSLAEVAGVEDGKISYKAMRKNKTAIFEILEETLEQLCI